MRKRYSFVVSVWSASAVLVGPLTPLSQAVDLQDRDMPPPLPVYEAGAGGFYEEHGAAPVDPAELWASIGYEYVEGESGMLLEAGATLTLVEADGPIGETSYISAAVHDGMTIELPAESLISVVRSAVSAGSLELANGTWQPLVMLELEIWHPTMGPGTETVMAPIFAVRSLVEAVQVSTHVAGVLRDSALPTCSGFGGSVGPRDDFIDPYNFHCRNENQDCLDDCAIDYGWRIGQLLTELGLEGAACALATVFVALCVAAVAIRIGFLTRELLVSHEACLDNCKLRLAMCNRGIE